MAALGLAWSSDDLPCNLDELSQEAAALCLEVGSWGSVVCLTNPISQPQEAWRTFPIHHPAPQRRTTSADLLSPSPPQCQHASQAASEGLAAAQHEAGVCYSEGRGVEKDEQEAVRWFRRAANQGRPWGQFSLGCAYAEVSHGCVNIRPVPSTTFGCAITRGP